MLQQVPLGNGSYRWQWVGIEGTKRGQQDEEGKEWAVFSGEVLAIVTGGGKISSCLFDSVLISA